MEWAWHFPTLIRWISISSKFSIFVFCILSLSLVFAFFIETLSISELCQRVWVNWYQLQTFCLWDISQLCQGELASALIEWLPHQISLPPHYKRYKVDDDDDDNDDDTGDNNDDDENDDDDDIAFHDREWGPP